MRPNSKIRKPVDCCPKLLIGQDECIIKENLFSSQQWNGSEGQNVIRPKDDGHSWMLSSFISRAWSFNVDHLLSPNKLNEINNLQQQHEYLSVESPMEVKNSTQKKDIQDSSPFCRFFDYRASKEGYWNVNHAALQLEDLVDCLIVLFPNVDFIFLFDQSSGHGKHQKDGLSANLMNRGWGGAGPIMHSTQIESACLGPYPKTLKVGDVQTMTFGEDDNGPFDYVKYERKHWLDQNGNILPQFELDAKKFLLTDLLSECP